MYKKTSIKTGHSISGFYSFFKKQFDEKYKTEGEIHDFWELVYVVDGKLGLTAGKDIHVLKSGQAILHKPMEFHNIWSIESQMQAIFFTFDGVLPKHDKRIFDLTENEINTIESLLSEARKVFTYEDASYTLISGINNGMELRAERFLKKSEIFIMDLLNEDAEQSALTDSIGANNYTKIASFLSENISKQLTIPDIASAVNMSESNVKKVFKKYTGIGIIQYFNTIKMRRAQALIRKGMSIKEVSKAVGFSDQNYFSTVFKRIVGICPKEYRNRL